MLKIRINTNRGLAEGGVGGEEGKEREKEGEGRGRGRGKARETHGAQAALRYVPYLQESVETSGSFRSVVSFFPRCRRLASPNNVAPWAPHRLKSRPGCFASAQGQR